MQLVFSTTTIRAPKVEYFLLVFQVLSSCEILPFLLREVPKLLSILTPATPVT